MNDTKKITYPYSPPVNRWIFGLIALMLFTVYFMNKALSYNDPLEASSFLWFTMAQMQGIFWLLSGVGVIVFLVISSIWVKNITEPKKMIITEDLWIAPVSPLSKKTIQIPLKEMRSVRMITRRGQRCIQITHTRGNFFVPTKVLGSLDVANGLVRTLEQRLSK